MMDHEAVTHCYSNSSNSIQTEAGGKGQPSIQIAPAWELSLPHTPPRMFWLPVSARYHVTAVLPLRLFRHSLFSPA